MWDYYTDWKHKSGMGPLFVIDECQLALPRGKVDPHVAEWYSLHRHYNCDVLLLTQAYGRIDKSIVDLVQLVYRVRKAVAFGLNSKYIRKVQDGVRGEVVSTSMRVYEKRYFGLYKSHTQGHSVGEEGASDTRPIWMAWPILAAVACFVVVGVFAAMPACLQRIRKHICNWMRSLRLASLRSGKRKGVLLGLVLSFTSCSLS